MLRGKATLLLHHLEEHPQVVPQFLFECQPFRFAYDPSPIQPCPEISYPVFLWNGIFDVVIWLFHVGHIRVQQQRDTNMTASLARNGYSELNSK